MSSVAIAAPLPAAACPPSRAGLGAPARTDDGPRLRGTVLAAVILLHVLALALVLARSPAEPVAITPPILVSLVTPPRPEAPPAPPVAVPPPPKVAPKVDRPQLRTPPRPTPEPVSMAPTALAGPVAEPEPPAPAAPAEVKAEKAPAPAAPPSPPRFDAAYLNNQTPYPPLAKRLRETGTVQLRVLVSAQGMAENIELLSSSGSPRLDEGAQAAVRRWRFIPARQGDQNIASTVVVPIIFKLEES
jgi:protein TonB